MTKSTHNIIKQQHPKVHTSHTIYTLQYYYTSTEEVLAGEKSSVLNWSSGSVDDCHAREQVGLEREREGGGEGGREGGKEGGREGEREGETPINSSLHQGNLNNGKQKLIYISYEHNTHTAH